MVPPAERSFTHLSMILVMHLVVFDSISFFFVFCASAYSSSHLGGVDLHHCYKFITSAF